MTPLFELTRLVVRPAQVSASRLEAALAKSPPGGQLAGAWSTEIGTLNQIVLLHTVDDAAASRAARARRSESGDLFGHSDVAVSMTVETFAGFSFMPPLTSGRFGPVYELREYLTQPDGIAGTMDVWKTALPPRLELSRLLLAAYALEGAQPRFIHLWPYQDLNDRARVRGDAIARGIWPPKGGAARLAFMQNSILLPLPFSPLQ